MCGVVGGVMCEIGPEHSWFKTVRVRKARPCDECGEPIERGDEARVWVSLDAGEWKRTYHCRRGECEPYGDWGDE